MKKVMVTGASGFVGKALCRELAKSGYAVVGVVRQITERIPFVEYIETDLVNREPFAGGFPAVDCVIHLAGRAHVLKENAPDPLAAFREVNRDATITLARRALQAGVQRFVFVSSIGVTGHQTEQAAFTENTPNRPHADYAVSKFEAENELTVLLRDSAMEWVIVRPPLIYASDAPGNFGRLLKLAASGFPLPLGNLCNLRSVISRDNLIGFLMVCVEHPAAAGECFLVADGQDISTSDMVRAMRSGMGKRAALFPFPGCLLRYALTLLGKSSIYEQLCGSLQVDASKARALLGWSPQETTQEGLRQASRIYARERKALKY